MYYVVVYKGNGISKLERVENIDTYVPKGEIRRIYNFNSEGIDE